MRAVKGGLAVPWGGRCGENRNQESGSLLEIGCIGLNTVDFCYSNWGESEYQMQYGLQKDVLSSNAFVSITAEEYSRISAAKAGLLEVLFLEEKFDLLMENYLEFETALLDSSARMMLHRNQDYQWFQLERSLFNRRLVNLLSASRSYIDYSKHHIRVALPEVNEAVAKIDQEFARHYDSSLGYRVMEALRNFVQHRGLPVHAVEYPQGWLGVEDDAQLRFGLALFTKTEYLGEDDKFKKPVLEELIKLGGRVDLKPLV